MIGEARETYEKLTICELGAEDYNITTCYDIKEEYYRWNQGWETEQRGSNSEEFNLE